MASKGKDNDTAVEPKLIERPDQSSSLKDLNERSRAFHEEQSRKLKENLDEMTCHTLSKQGEEGNLLAIHPTVKPVAMIATLSSIRPHAGKLYSIPSWDRGQPCWQRSGSGASATESRSILHMWMRRSEKPSNKGVKLGFGRNSLVEEAR